LTRPSGWVADISFVKGAGRLPAGSALLFQAGNKA
jgi:hypothetical protein